VSQELTNLKKAQKKYTAQEKVGYLRRHLVEKDPVGKLCDEGGMRPTVFYSWQEKVFSDVANLFERSEGESRKSEQQERIERLEKKLQQKDEVLAELMSEYVALKKELGGF
jgi:transposase